MDLEKTLAAAPLLAELDEGIIKRLAEQGVRRVYPAGDWIIRQDAPASALYIILRGRARAEKDGEQDRTPSELYPGDFFGELALIEDHPRTASVLAVERPNASSSSPGSSRRSSRSTRRWPSRS